MSTANHTKNQLARISAKIQQLKRRYPTSNQLYMHSDKRNGFTQDSIHDQPQKSNITLQSTNKDYQEIKNNLFPLKLFSKVPTNENNYNLPNQSLPYNHSQNTRFYQEKNSHQSCSKRDSLNDKQNHYVADLSLNYQKPFKQYKEELKTLKREILSSLDFQNFTQSKPRVSQISKVQEEAKFETFNKNQVRKKNIASLNITKIEPKYQIYLPIQEADNQTSISSINNFKFNEQEFSSKTRYEPASEQVLQSLKSIQNLSRLLHQFNEQFNQFRQQTLILQNTTKAQNQKLQSKIQNLSKQLESKQLFKQITSQSDFKIIEVQNQAMNKLNKQIHKELNVINQQITQIKNDLNQFTKNNQVKEKNQINSTFTSKEIEEFDLQQEHNIHSINEFNQMTQKFFDQHTYEKFKSQMLEFSNEKIKQIQIKFIGTVLDLKNQFQLIQQKISRQNYLQKTLKYLIPQNFPTVSQLNIQVKNHLLFDLEFHDSVKKLVMQNFRQQSENQQFYLNDIKIQIQNLKAKIDKQERNFKQYLKEQITEHKLGNSMEYISKFPQQTNELRLQISQVLSSIDKIHIQISKVNRQLTEQLSSQINTINKTFKQIETKMISYSLLIQNIEQGLKEVSISCNDQELQNQIIKKIKQAVIGEISHQFSQKLQAITSSISQLSLKNSQIIQQSNSHQQLPETSINSLQLIANQVNKDFIQTSKISIFTNQESNRLLNDKIQLTFQEERQQSKLIKSEYKDRILSNQPQLFLLNELVKNSYIFDAFNH